MPGPRCPGTGEWSKVKSGKKRVIVFVEEAKCSHRKLVLHHLDCRGISCGSSHLKRKDGGGLWALTWDHNDRRVISGPQAVVGAAQNLKE